MNRKFKKCLITGISGSGGSYLAEYILSKTTNLKNYQKIKQEETNRVHAIQGKNINTVMALYNKIKPNIINNIEEIPI